MKSLKVRIEDEVYEDLQDFYDFNLKKHPTLDEVTVLNKEQRLIGALKRLGTYALTDHKIAQSYMQQFQRELLLLYSNQSRNRQTTLLT